MSQPTVAAIYPDGIRVRDRWILSRRPARAAVDVRRPHAYVIEHERAADGETVEVATLFLTGRECPWRCLMCDLWKNTTEERTPVGAIPAQIDFALAELGSSRCEEALTEAGELPGEQGSMEQSGVSFPLTPNLSAEERESGRRRVEQADADELSSGGDQRLPLLGERVGVREKEAHELVGEVVGSSGRTGSPRHIKLYNSGSFFDRAAVPFEDYEAIARRVASFERVIVESHPALIGEATLHFRDLLAREAKMEAGSSSEKPVAAEVTRLTIPSAEEIKASSRRLLPSCNVPRLEVAMGLETAHPDVLAKLNKRFTLDDFARAAEFLRREGIALRVFVLVKPPFMDEGEGLEWAVRSAKFAFDCGATVVSLIPTRFGNGALEALATAGQFAPPHLASVEAALELGIALGRGRVFADLWDLEKFSNCPACFPARRDRLRRLNLEQQFLPPILCDRCP